jgi:hypothetical protein
MASVQPVAGDRGKIAYLKQEFTNAFLKATARNNVSVLDFIVHYLLHVSALYGGFKKSISGYTRNRMQNPTIKEYTYFRYKFWEILV